MPALDRVTFILTRFLIQVGKAQNWMALLQALEIIQLYLHVLPQTAQLELSQLWSSGTDNPQPR